jgi:quinol monooxygenase YgiN
MAALTVIADIRANPDRVDFVRAELEKLIPATRAEEGCLQYDLHQDDADPAHFLFYETWESRELWQVHMSAAHLEAYRKAVDGALAAFTLHEMRRIG